MYTASLCENTTAQAYESIYLNNNNHAGQRRVHDVRHPLVACPHPHPSCASQDHGQLLSAGIPQSWQLQCGMAIMRAAHAARPGSQLRWVAEQPRLPGVVSCIVLASAARSVVNGHIEEAACFGQHGRQRWLQRLIQQHGQSSCARDQRSLGRAPARHRPAGQRRTDAGKPQAARSAAPRRDRWKRR